MNTETRLQNDRDLLAKAPQARTLQQRIHVADRLFKEKVVCAFGLAKSAGCELNVTFLGTPGKISSATND